MHRMRNTILFVVLLLLVAACAPNSQDKVSLWQTTAILSLFISVLLIVVTALFVLNWRKQQQVKLHHQLALINKLRMNEVRNRITPHFIFNVLNAVLPSFMQHRDLEEPLHKLVKVIRHSLIDSESIALSLGDEICHVQEFLQLRSIGYPESENVEWEIGTDVSLETSIPCMCIQIPIENALKYAFPPSSLQSKPTIRVAIHYSITSLCITIEDNGSGFRPKQEVAAATNQGTGSGLNILRRTVEMLNRNNDSPIDFRITNLSDLSPELHGTRVSIHIPSTYRFEL